MGIMKNLSPIYDLIRANGSIVVNKNLIFSMGMNESVIFTELIAKYTFFNNKEQLTEDGYFFNTVDNLLLDTGLSERSQRKAIKRLVEYKLLDYKVQGQPPKRYFRIVDNSELLLDFISEGRGIRDLLEEKMAIDIDKSKLRLNAVLQNNITQECIQTERSVNNTKLNNTKKNNTKERYIILPNDDHTYTQIYCLYYKQMFDKAHMQITESNYIELKEWIHSLVISGIDKDYYIEKVEEHFNTLPKRNDGNILSFMQASFRYFEVQNPKQIRSY